MPTLLRSIFPSVELAGASQEPVEFAESLSGESVAIRERLVEQGIGTKETPWIINQALRTLRKKERFQKKGWQIRDCKGILKKSSCY